jgi:hypothetical protein
MQSRGWVTQNATSATQSISDAIELADLASLLEFFWS